MSCLQTSFFEIGNVSISMYSQLVHLLLAHSWYLCSISDLYLGSQSQLNVDPSRPSSYLNKTFKMATFLQPTLLLVLFALSTAQPPPVGLGQACSLNGFFPIPCQARLTCVLTDFGFPAADGPRIGTCRNLTNKPPSCTVAYCTTNGPNAICTTFGFPMQPVVATCHAWATRIDAKGPDCNFACTLRCLVVRLVASDGTTYCNLCLLQAASCRSDFKVFGPVKPVKDKCVKPISIFDAAKCCIDRGIGCLKKGQTCSTMGSRIQPVPCKKGLTCVIMNFGFPAVDRPNSGTCRRVRRVKKCSVRRCSRRGEKSICQTGTIVTTCGAWATRTDGNPGPDCSFVCPEICLVLPQRPLGSDGVRYCTICKLRQASCRSDFVIFGPIRKWA